MDTTELSYMAFDMAKTHGDEWHSALVAGEDGNYHALISVRTGEEVIRAADDSLKSSWICDYLEAVSPKNILTLLATLEKTQAAVIPSELRDRCERIVAGQYSYDMQELAHQVLTCAPQLVAENVVPLHAVTETVRDVKSVARQNVDLVMIVKMLVRKLRQNNPNSLFAESAMNYLHQQGLISATDCLRGGEEDK